MPPLAPGASAREVLRAGNDQDLVAVILGPVIGGFVLLLIVRGVLYVLASRAAERAELARIALEEKRANMKEMRRIAKLRQAEIERMIANGEMAPPPPKVKKVAKGLRPMPGAKKAPKWAKKAPPPFVPKAPTPPGGPAEATRGGDGSDGSESEGEDESESESDDDEEEADNAV